METNNLPILGKMMCRIWKGEYYGNDAIYFEQEDGTDVVQ